MITSLKFENFKGFPELNIPRLNRLNLFSGANNVGKTSILEGIYLLSSREWKQASQLPHIFRSNISGNMSQTCPEDEASFWQSLFFDGQLELPVKISAMTDLGKELTCKLSARDNLESANLPEKFEAPQAKAIAGSGYGTSNAPIAAFDLGSGVKGRITGNTIAATFAVIANRFEQPLSDAELFNRVLLREGAEEKLFAQLKLIEPRLTKLRYARAPGSSQPLIYAHFGLKNALVLTQAGRGFNKLFSLFAHMILGQAQVVLIDGIEDSLCSETLPDIWRGIATQAAAANVQVFATTYTRECVLAAHDALKTLPNYDLTYHRISRSKGQFEVVSHDAGMLETAIKSGLVIR